MAGKKASSVKKYHFDGLTNESVWNLEDAVQFAGGFLYWDPAQVEAAEVYDCIVSPAPLGEVEISASFGK